jgi:hypothetical protein
MTVKTRHTLFIAIGLFIFCAFLVVMVCSRKKSTGPEPEIVSKTNPNGVIAEFLKLRLFYYTESSALLQAVHREIQIPDSREELYKKFMDLLLAGSSGMILPVPEGVQLRGLFYLPKMELLVLDFNENLVNAFPGGTAAELEFIYFIVDNICANFPEIKKVKFLSGGNEIRTLAGHIEMDQAFFPDLSRLKSE